MAEKNADCPCRNHGCHRRRDCEACREYHHGRGSATACERMKGDGPGAATLNLSVRRTYGSSLS
jgi:hypothetical protein